MPVTLATQLWWYVARAGGLVAWALVVASCVWGLLHATRALGRRPTPAWMLSTHRYLGALAVVFTAVHVLALLADSFVQFDPVDVLVPLVSPWHPVAVAWGVIGMWLLVAVEVTSLVRQRLSQGVWRAIHLSSYAVFALVSVHMLSAGTDAKSIVPETLAVALGVLAVFGAALLLTWRSAPKVRPSLDGGDSLVTNQ
ncbi:MAG: ferric reductase-like transmembrane domain-containing protein [Acidimicrobiia bacterium]